MAGYSWPAISSITNRFTRFIAEGMELVKAHQTHITEVKSPAAGCGKGRKTLNRYIRFAIGHGSGASWIITRHVLMEVLAICYRQGTGRVGKPRFRAGSLIGKRTVIILKICEFSDAVL